MEVEVGSWRELVLDTRPPDKAAMAPKVATESSDMRLPEHSILILKSPNRSWATGPLLLQACLGLGSLLAPGSRLGSPPQARPRLAPSFWLALGLLAPGLASARFWLLARSWARGHYGP